MLKDLDNQKKLAPAKGWSSFGRKSAEEVIIQDAAKSLALETLLLAS